MQGILDLVGIDGVVGGAGVCQEGPVHGQEQARDALGALEQGGESELTEPLALLGREVMIEEGRDRGSIGTITLSINCLIPKPATPFQWAEQIRPKEYKRRLRWLRRKLAQVPNVEIEAMRLNGQRFLTKQLKGEELGSETSINKLTRAELEVEFGELAMEILGSRGPLMQCDDAPEGGKWASFALGWPEVVIGGGTPNIQKNIIGERILGLPKD